MQKVLSPATYVCSHWMFFRSAFISARTAFDFCAAARSASRSALPMAGMARSITYLGMTFAPYVCVRIAAICGPIIPYPQAEARRVILTAQETWYKEHA